MSPTAVSGSVALRHGVFNGVKVFSATMVAQREVLGDTVTTWMSKHPHLAITAIVVTQSSDASFHCIAISVFYREELAASERNVQLPPKEVSR